MTSNFYLCANEDMELVPLCLVLMEKHIEPGQAGLLIRVPTLMKKNESTFVQIVGHLPIYFLPTSYTVKKELHFIPEQSIQPLQAATFIEQVLGNPFVLELMEEKIHMLANKQEISSEVLSLFNEYKDSLRLQNATSFTVSTQSKGLFLLEQQGEIIQKVGPFKLTERGGFFNFTVTVATLYDQIAQTIPVNCKMYLFLDKEKLGYYFEFFLNKKNLLHNKIYEQLPELLMNNHPFLEKTLGVLESCTYDQPSVVELIERFRESI